MADEDEGAVAAVLYAAECLLRWYGDGTTVTWDAIAEELDLSKPAVLNLKKHKRGMGIKVERAIAKKFHEGSIDAFHEAARRWYVESGAAERARKEPIVEYDHALPAHVRAAIQSEYVLAVLDDPESAELARLETGTHFKDSADATIHEVKADYLAALSRVRRAARDVGAKEARNKKVAEDTTWLDQQLDEAKKRRGAKKHKAPPSDPPKK